MGERRTTSWLVLLELVFVLAFFAFSCAVCLRLFAEAKAVSVRSRDLSRATGHAQSAAEAFKAVGPQPHELALLLEGTERTGNVDGPLSLADESLLPGVTVRYNKDWEPVADEELAVYCLTLSLWEEDGFWEAAILVNRLDQTDAIYSLHALRYLPGEEEEANGA